MLKTICRMLGVLALVPLAAVAAPEPQMPEDVFPALRQILADASKESPRVIAQNMNLLIAEGDLKQARAGLYPSLGGSYQFSKAKDQREDVPGTLDTDKIYYSLGLTQPLFHWGAIKNNAKIGEIRRQIADENYGEAQRLLAQEIRSGYLSLILNKIWRKNAAYGRSLAEDSLKVAEERLQKKVISEGAIFQTRIAADQARLGDETAEWNFRVAKKDFSMLTGQAELSDDQIPDQIPGLIESSVVVDQLLSQFLAQGEPDTANARILRQQIKVDDLSYKIQRTRLRPKLNFVAGITQDQQSYSITLQQYGLKSQYVGLQVSWSIFDGFATRGAVASALARKRLDEHSYKEFSDKVAWDAQKAARAVDLAQRQLAISERLLNNAENFLAYTKEDFKRGQASETEVSNAQAGYNNMHSSANSVRADYLRRVSEFVSLISSNSTVAR